MMIIKYLDMTDIPDNQSDYQVYNKFAVIIAQLRENRLNHDYLRDAIQATIFETGLMIIDTITKATPYVAGGGEWCNVVYNALADHGYTSRQISRMRDHYLNYLKNETEIS